MMIVEQTKMIEQIEQIGLVLEGGGMRGVYTAGVLDALMEKEFYLPYVVGVSAGACHAASYISRQVGRNKRVNIGYVSDPRYLSYRNLIKSKSLFGMDFIFDEIPRKHDPFDFDTFKKASQIFEIGTTDCRTGRPIYFEKNTYGDDILTIVRASSSLPFVAPVVEFRGISLLDGGIADPIPIRRAMAKGYDKNIVVLTQQRGYRKKPFKYHWLAKRIYSHYPGLVEAMVQRHEVYNRTLDDIELLEAERKVFVIRPKQPLKVGRIERDSAKLTALFQDGYHDATERFPEILRWMKA